MRSEVIPYLTAEEYADKRALANEFIPLRLAALCISCETIFPLAAVRCPACDGAACMPLGAWLRSTKERRQEIE